MAWVEAEHVVDLASTVANRLRGSGPSERTLTRIFEVLFSVSLRTDEGRQIACSIAYLDPDNPDPSPPERIVLDRWECKPLRDRVPMTERNLAKLAPACDPAFASLAVCSKNQEPYIWGGDRSGAGEEPRVSGDGIQQGP